MVMAWRLQLAAGGLAGVLTWASVYPLDIVKTKLQIQATSAAVKAGDVYSGVWDCLRKTYQEGGSRALTRGLMATLIRGAK